MGVEWRQYDTRSDWNIAKGAFWRRDHEGLSLAFEKGSSAEEKTTLRGLWYRDPIEIAIPVLGAFRIR